MSPSSFSRERSSGAFSRRAFFCISINGINTLMIGMAVEEDKEEEENEEKNYYY